MASGIYIISNIQNNKVYIGQTKNLSERMRKHKEALRSNRHFSDGLQQDWNKYGEKFFTMTVLEEINLAPKEILYSREIFWISFYRNKEGFSTYNISGGGAGGGKMAKSTKQILSRVSTENNPMYWLGKHRSEETKAKISRANKGKLSGNKHPLYGTEGHWKGKHHTEETKEKISKARKGHTVSEETRAKISASRKGTPGYGKVIPSQEMLSDIKGGISKKDFVSKYPYSVNVLKRIKKELKQNGQ